MHAIERIRADTLSSRNCSFEIDDPVIFRRHPGAHEEFGRVVGRNHCPPFLHDVVTGDGTHLFALSDVRLDEEALKVQRAAQGLG